MAEGLARGWLRYGRGPEGAACRLPFAREPELPRVPGFAHRTRPTAALLCLPGKLKELGNTVLGKFGLSLDNFKADKDPATGSYSIKFQQ